MVAVELEPLIQQKKPLSAGLAVVIVLVILLPSVILGVVLYVWVTSMTPTTGGTPYCTLVASTSGTGTGLTQVNVTWTITSPSRADIKWSDVPQSYAKFLDDGVFITPAAFTVTTWPTGTYVTGWDTIKVTLNRSTVASGSIIKLVLVYAPSGGTFGECSLTVTYS